MERLLAQADEGDYHFELKKEDGKYKCLRSDVSDPAYHPEEVTDLRDIPSKIFKIFNRFMH